MQVKIIGPYAINGGLISELEKEANKFLKELNEDALKSIEWKQLESKWCNGEVIANFLVIITY